MLVQVLATRGSVPREAGTRMLVAADALAGTIGGGHLEWQAIAQARRLLAEGATAPVELRLALGPALGQCCGGALTLRLGPLHAALLADWAAAAPRFTLQLYGAGHVGRAVARLLGELPCAVQWIDEREAEFPLEPSPPHLLRRCVEPVEAVVATAAPGAFYLVMTHSHALDFDLVNAVLARGDAGWLGLIGSAAKRASFAQRLRQRGHGDAALARLRCPVGIAGITGKEPEVIAVAVVAELLLASSAA
jgi:xanthine dehydrogenase accessory factor